jgi:hypothetical protein
MFGLCNHSVEHINQEGYTRQLKHLSRLKKILLIDADPQNAITHQ